MGQQRSTDEILADVVQLVVGVQVPISIIGGPQALGTGYEAWQRLRQDISGTSFGWLGTDTAEYIDRLKVVVGGGEALHKLATSFRQVAEQPPDIPQKVWRDGFCDGLRFSAAVCDLAADGKLVADADGETLDALMTILQKAT